MSHRIGECSSCGAVYKLPSTFAHDQARCKKCGGVVQIGPAQFPEAHESEASAPAAPPVPARKVAPKPPAQKAPAAKPVAPKPRAAAPPPAPAKKDRSGPSMKDKILARQREQETAAAPAKASGAKKAAPASRRPAAKASSVAPARPGRGARADAPAGAASSRRSAPSRSRRAAAVEEEEVEPSSRRAGARGRAPKKKNASLLPGLIAIVLLLGIGGGAYFFITGKDAAPDEVAQADPEGTEGGETAGGTDPAAEALDAPSVTDDTSGTEDVASTDGTPADVDATEGAPADEGSETESAPEPAKPKAQGDPDSVDLSTIPDFGPPDGTDEARWDELRQLAADVVDPMAGAAGNRAKLQLEEAGKAAVPALINVIKKLDLTTDDGFRSADVVTKTLQFACNNKNFGWKYTHQDGWLYYDKRVIETWSTFWTKAKDDEAYWLRITGLDKVEEAEPAKEDEPLIGEDEFDFDDGF